MFRSKTRNLIFPQSEHLRLVGSVALHWGNQHFDRPELPFDSFAAGVTLHDWGHGFFDLNEIGAMDSNERVQSMDNLVHAQLPDTVAEIVMQFHVLRLMGDESIYDELRPIHLERINANITKVGIARSKFEWADRITNLADMISFNFCFGDRKQNTIPVYAKLADTEQTDVTYEIGENGQIALDPWPLNVDSVTGYLLGYDADAYPQTPKPTVVRYQLVPLV